MALRLLAAALSLSSASAAVHVISLDGLQTALDRGENDIVITAMLPITSPISVHHTTGLTIRGDGGSSGFDGQGTTRLFEIEDADATFTGLSFTRGEAPTTGSAEAQFGGCLAVRRSTVVIEHASFTSCTAGTRARCRHPVVSTKKPVLPTPP